MSEANIGKQKKELFQKIKCKPSFGCWMMGCSYEDNPEKCPHRIWTCEKCGSENLKTPPRTGDGGFDAYKNGNDMVMLFGGYCD